MLSNTGVISFSAGLGYDKPMIASNPPVKMWFCFSTFPKGWFLITIWDFPGAPILKVSLKKCPSRSPDPKMTLSAILVLMQV